MLYCSSRVRSASFLMIPSVRQCGCSLWTLARPSTVGHQLLAEKLKSLPLNPCIIYCWLGFLRDRKQKVIFGSSVCNWKTVNKGITQGSVSGPYLFNIFLNDQENKLGNETLGFKYADDCTIIAPVYYDIDHPTDLINQFVRWAGQNRMNSNSTKCKELIKYKKRIHCQGLQ